MFILFSSNKPFDYSYSQPLGPNVVFLPHLSVTALPLKVLFSYSTNIKKLHVLST